jgi:hypothetical protein
LQIKKSSRAFYEIRVEDALGDLWSGWFEGLDVYQETSKEDGQCVSVISGLISDQPALHGILARIRDLNLTLISVQKVIKKGETYHENQ